MYFMKNVWKLIYCQRGRKATYGDVFLPFSGYKLRFPNYPRQLRHFWEEYETARAVRCSPIAAASKPGEQKPTPVPVGQSRLLQRDWPVNRCIFTLQIPACRSTRCRWRPRVPPLKWALLLPSSVALWGPCPWSSWSWECSTSSSTRTTRCELLYRWSLHTLFLTSSLPSFPPLSNLLFKIRWPWGEVLSVKIYILQFVL